MNNISSFRLSILRVTIADKLKFLRSMRNLTLDELSRKTGYDASTLRDIEDGLLVPTLPCLVELATYLDIDTLHLLKE